MNSLLLKLFNSRSSCDFYDPNKYIYIISRMKKKQQALIELIETLPTKHKIRCVEDLLNGLPLLEFMKSLLDEDSLHHLNLAHPPVESFQPHAHASRTRYFQQLLGALKQYCQDQSLGFSVDIDIDRIAQQQDLGELYRLVKYMFLVLTSRKELVEHMTQLSNESQMSLMSLIKSAESIVGKTREATLLEDIEKLEGELEQMREREDSMREQGNGWQEDKARLENIIESLASEIENTKRNNWSLEELEANLVSHQKQIEVLTLKNQQLSNELFQQKSLLKLTTQQYQKQIDNLKDKLESCLKQIDKLELRTAQIDVLRSRGENDEHLHNIVSNLEMKCQQLSEKIETCQLENHDLVREISQKENLIERFKEQIGQLEANIQQLIEQREAYYNLTESKAATPRYLDASLKDKPPSEILPSGECQRRQCTNKKSQLQTLKKKYIQVLSHLQTPSTDYIGECHRIIDEKSKIIEEYRDKLAKTTSQNLRLKEKLICNSTGHIYEANMAKLKTKNSNLKKKLEDLEAERKRDYDSLIQVKKMYNGLVIMLRKCPLCAKLIQV